VSSWCVTHSTDTCTHGRHYNDAVPAKLPPSVRRDEEEVIVEVTYRGVRYTAKGQPTTVTVDNRTRETTGRFDSWRSYELTGKKTFTLVIEDADIVVETQLPKRIEA